MRRQSCLRDFFGDRSGLVESTQVIFSYREFFSYVFPYFPNVFLMALALFFDNGHLDGCQVVDSCSPAPELSFEKKARTWGGAQVTDGQSSVLGHMKDT